jgi:hypothetical protein
MFTPDYLQSNRLASLQRQSNRHQQCSNTYFFDEMVY